MKPAIEDVLEEVNAIRAEWDMDPLTVMPKGTRGDCDLCVLAKALDAEVGVQYYHPGGIIQHAKPLSDVLYRFRTAFDDGEYPELVA